MPATAALDLIQDPARAAALLHPLRLRLLEGLRQPDSATGLARRLRLPRQKINYHLRELEKERLVELVEERRKGNCIERVVQATARTYLINPAALGRLAADPAEMQDRFSSSYVVALAARAIRDLAVLGARAKKAGKRLATFSLQSEVRFASAADRNAFSEELASQVARLAAKYHDEKAPGGRRFKFFLGAYPTITKKEEK
jgi:DNA-binding transcriptional ArsR family regulator